MEQFGKSINREIIKNNEGVDRYKVDGFIESNDNETTLETTKDYEQEGIDFVTSTPKKQKLDCEECMNISAQCPDCFVEDYMKKIHKDDMLI